MRAHILERHVRGDTRVPELVEDIELAMRAVITEHVGGELDLVGVGISGQPQRMLVERREHQRIDGALARQLQAFAQIGEREAAARG